VIPKAKRFMKDIMEQLAFYGKKVCRNFCRKTPTYLRHKTAIFAVFSL
jgi:hypothetical protein